KPAHVTVAEAGAQPGQPGEPRDGARHQPQTHFSTFRSMDDYLIVNRASRYLEASGFYWGPMTVEVAHSKLKSEPPGTFLIRDSSQNNCFFSLSVSTHGEAISTRIRLRDGLFRLDCHNESFDCVMKLIEHFTVSPQKFLGKPLRKVRLQSLQEICRKRIIESFGKENTARLPLNPFFREYLDVFPFRI
uniref:Suppressor of cytokine signaling 1a n=1 Tax=Callorhinchus milii TaxID=7868 RepID=A0A4W3HUJ9_CALMI